LDAIIDAKSNETSFRYDELGRLKRKNWADGSSYEEFEYDAVGNRTAHRLADGNVNRYSYDTLNRLNGVRLFNEGITTTIGYTPNGLRSSVLDSRGTTSYVYDNRDRLKFLTQPVKDTAASASYNQSVEYAYDPAGNRTSITTRNQSGTTQSSVSYVYDGAYRLKTATESGQNATTYNYNPLGLRTEQLLPNGRAVRYSYATSTPDRLEVVKHQLATDPVVATPLLSYSYSFDTGVAAGKAGLRTGLTETKNGTTTASYLWEYDSAYRLKKEKKTVGANPLVETGYDYDAAGNRTRTTLGEATTATYEYDKLDRLLLLKTATGAISEEYGYNPRGNLAQIKADGTIARTFQWDGADRMIGATAGGTTLGMQYDVDGRRVQLSASGVITNYLWDITSRYGDVLLESGSNGAFKTSYVLGSGELISQKRGANPREYYLLDGQGSVRGLTNDTGTLTQEYAYDTFGKPSGDLTKSAYLYTGQQYDAMTELYSLRARYYNPQQGRFLSMDKWQVVYQNPVELNRYGYTANNPVNWNDPSGLSIPGVADPTSTTETTQRKSAGSEYSMLVIASFGVMFSTVGLYGMMLGCVLTFEITHFFPDAVDYFSSAATANCVSKDAVNRSHCQTAIKLLEQYERLAAKYNIKINEARLKQLNAKRDAGTITCEDLPGGLQREFPGEFKGMTLAEIRIKCR
jgi:RHS repeat-associated protein